MHHLVEEGARDVVTGFPGIDQVIVVPRKELKRQLLRGRLTILNTLRTQLREARYDAVVALLARTDTEKAVAGYRRLYPQLQKAYEDLGYPNGYLNDRVVEVIDHLLETPEPTGPLLLEQPKVLYRFADDDLESRSAGQKLLLRMGVDHARVVKEKLRAVRALIIGKE
jgi:ADP-heptose:LPS heptosyltransferase